MRKIAFTNIEVERQRRLTLTATVQTETQGETEYALWFQSNRELTWSFDCIALALSTLCGRTYTDIDFEFPVSDPCLRSLERFTLANIKRRGKQGPDEFSREGNLLSFSGGFDSLAALAVMPPDTKLVSLDFGGRFARERAFFSGFDTLIISTNVTETPLRANSWSFMGIAAILGADHHKAAYHTFGSILEAGADNFTRQPAAARGITFPPFAAAGYTDVPYVGGLTEIGTLLIILNRYPEYVAASLGSLASPGEEKRYRKQVLTDLVCNRSGISVEIERVPAPAKPHFLFGQNFAIDFLALYVLKFAGRDVADSLVAGIPRSIEQKISSLDLSFYERANSTMYSNFPLHLMAGLTGNLSDVGIRFYTERDWENFSRIRELLAETHHTLTKN